MFGQTDSFAERARPVEESRKAWARESVADGVLDRAMRAGKLQPSSRQSARHHRRCLLLHDPLALARTLITYSLFPSYQQSRSAPSSGV